MLEPGHALTEVGAGHDVDVAIAIDVQRRVGEVFVIVRIRAPRDIPNFVPGPVGGRVPRIAAEDVQPLVAIEVGDTDGLKR